MTQDLGMESIEFEEITFEDDLIDTLHDYKISVFDDIPMVDHDDHYMYFDHFTFDYTLETSLDQYSDSSPSRKITLEEIMEYVDKDFQDLSIGEEKIYLDHFDPKIEIFIFEDVMINSTHHTNIEYDHITFEDKTSINLNKMVILEDDIMTCNFEKFTITTDIDDTSKLDRISLSGDFGVELDSIDLGLIYQHLGD